MKLEGIGKRIRQARKMRGLTQEELAEKTKLSTMSIRRYESEERMTTEGNYRKIADALDMDYLWLIDGAGEMNSYIMLHDDLDKILPTWSYDLMNEYFSELNKNGQKIAAQRVGELTKIPEYRKDYKSEE